MNGPDHLLPPPLKIRRDGETNDDVANLTRLNNRNRHSLLTRGQLVQQLAEFCFEVRQ